MADLQNVDPPKKVQYLVSFSEEELDMLETVVERDAEEHGNWFLWNMTQGVFAAARRGR